MDLRDARKERIASLSNDWNDFPCFVTPSCGCCAEEVHLFDDDGHPIYDPATVVEAAEAHLLRMQGDYEKAATWVARFKQVNGV